MAIRRPTSDGHIICLESFLNLPALCTGKSKIFEKWAYNIFGKFSKPSSFMYW
jgi:hypothetical protein